jgi:hypothetical protein
VKLCQLVLNRMLNCLFAVQMPHYHAEEATRAIKPILGDYYMWDDREVGCMCMACFHRLHCDCKYVI